jgi:NAD(P)H-hydrate epimerase
MQMMENAGRGMAEVAVDLFRPRRVLVLAGPGRNGGGGLVAARHLSNRGVMVRVA